VAESQADTQEKTEQPTPRRLQEARKKGQVPRSRELSTVTVLLVAATGMFFLGAQMIADLASLMAANLTLAREDLGSGRGILSRLEAALWAGLDAIDIFLGVMLIAALAGPAAIGGWTFSAQALGMRWERLDPVKGLKRVFSSRGLMELTKALAKFVLITVVAVALLWQEINAMTTLSREALEPALVHVARIALVGFFVLCSALILIAVVDVPFQLWTHGRQLRMSRQEVKDEFKETEGKPEVRSRIRELQREVAQRRMMEAVPEADVVVTNPTHYAVALRYRGERMRAPRVVARGRGVIAERIRLLAGEHNVAVVRVPGLARAIYFSTESGEEIPAGLYVAVAQVLAYVYRLKESGGTAHPFTLPDELPIPEELRREDP
jgi:flagellar biosynthetic protein FlhB